LRVVTWVEDVKLLPNFEGTTKNTRECQEDGGRMRLFRFLLDLYRRRGIGEGGGNRQRTNSAEKLKD